MIRSFWKRCHGVPRGRFSLVLFIALVLLGCLAFWVDPIIQGPLEKFLEERVDDGPIGLYVFRYFGDAQGVLIAVLLTLTLGTKEKRRLLIPYVACLGIIGAGNDVLKDIVGRKRPNHTENKTEFYPFLHAFSDDKASTSFPSGHAAGGFANATFLSAMFPPAAPVFYGMAIGTGLHRIAEGKHFASDVIFGAIVGIYLSLLLQRLLGRFFGIRFPDPDEENPESTGPSSPPRLDNAPPRVNPAT